MATQTKTAAKGGKLATRKPRDQARPPINDIPLLEWIAAGIGLALALICLGFTGWDALLGERAPATIEVRLVGVRQTPHGFIADVEAVNHGGTAASQVVIAGTVRGADGPDTAEATFDYIPEQSSVSGGLVFESDPRAGDLKLRARSYVDIN